MPEFVPDLSAEERIVLAVDASTRQKALPLLAMAREAGAPFVKLGLELSSAPDLSWRECSRLAKTQRLGWVADAKIHDIPNTTAGIVRNLVALDHPPAAITIHASSGRKSMEAAQEIAGEAGVTMLAVTQLTSIPDGETQITHGMSASSLVSRLAGSAARAGVEGLVCSAQELAMIRSDAETAGLTTMIPGTRSVGADRGDQSRVMTPGEAILNGADFLVIGRQVSQAQDPAEAFAAVVSEIQESLVSMERLEA